MGRGDRLSRIVEGTLALVASSEFMTGVGLGLVSGAIGWLFGMATRHRMAAIGPGLAAIAVAIWLFVNGRAPTGIVVAIPLLAIIGGSGWLEGRIWRRGAGAVLGSAVLALGAPGSLGFRLVLFLGVAAVVFLVSAAEESLGSRVPTAVLFAASTLALMVGIPEVNRALLLAGSLLPLALLPIDRRRLGGAGAFAYPALFAWITMADGATANGGVVGVLASLGTLGLGYLAYRFANRIGGTARLVFGQMAWALFASRVAGVRRGVVSAVVVLSIGAAAVWWLSKLGGRDTESEVATVEKWGSER
jgi:hypothetical protein